MKRVLVARLRGGVALAAQARRAEPAGSTSLDRDPAGAFLRERGLE